MNRWEMYGFALLVLLVAMIMLSSVMLALEWSYRLTGSSGWGIAVVIFVWIPIGVEFLYRSQGW